MGIKLLNTFLQTNVKSDNMIVHLRTLRGKTIVIDASIYMYRFKAIGELIENIYKMCSLFRYYKIHALFIFDGKYRRDDKRETILYRKQQQLVAMNKHDKIKLKREGTSCKLKYDKITNQMANLKRTFTTISPSDIQEVKDILIAYGIMHITADVEADELCAALVRNKTAYACLSEDTDMFAYGCVRVLKYISLINHTVVQYNLNDILSSLNISFDNFKTLCFMSGTDYINKCNQNIFYNYKVYCDKFIKENNISFIEWLFNNNYLTSQQHDSIIKERIIYDNNVDTALNNIKYFIIRNKNYDIQKLKLILKNHGFIFSE